ncbi:MAG TPA: rhomboid family intramembrane serine protease [Myxococcales bacterium]|nr:rhomboid family intramembrane serine protease [Myxococcales bacterium]
MPPRSSIPMGNLALPPFTRGVKWLLIASVAISIVGRYVPGFAAAMAFSPADLWFRGFLWQPLTYTLVQTSVDGIIFAILGLWLLGGSLEAMWGTRRFVTFYFATSVLAALATAFVGLAFRSVAQGIYSGTGPVLNALAAAFAVLLPTATIFLVVLPLPARLLLPISAGITLLLMVFERRVAPYLPHAFALGAGVLFAGGMRTPRQLWLRVRVWWIDKRLRSRKLRVVRGEDEASGRGRSGSDKYLH